MAAATSSSASPAPVVRWEVEMDAGWGQFDTAAEAHLEETHGKGQKTTTLQTNGFTYHVNFGLMTQTNAQTGRERNIRRVTVSAGSWQVELDGGQWTAYDALVQAQLNAAQARRDTDATVTVRGTKYHIRLQPPEVQINDRTGFRRRVRCTMPIDSDSGSGSDGTVGAGGGGGGGGGAAAVPVVPALEGGGRFVEEAQLDLLLLAAARASDAVYGTGEQDFADEEGFTSELVEVATADGHDRVFVGSATVGEETWPMVAIRGTVITELMQWVQNFDIPQCEPSRLLRTDPQAAAALDVPNARVHEGYNDALSRLFNKAGLRGELDKAKVTCGGKQRVLVTGHSKGGGMGQVLALALVRAGWDVVLVTFGAPPTINQAALDFLANSERLQAIRVCNVMDVVPRSLDLHREYCHLGRHIVLDRLLLESVNVLAKVIKTAANSAANSDNDLLEMATGAGLHVAEHHSMKRYLENLRMWDGGRWSFLALAQHSMRTIYNILDALPEQQAK